MNPGVALERPLLDRSLRDLASRAGASVMLDAKVTSVEQENGNWKLLLRRGENPGVVRARFLVIATGRAATGLIDRSPEPESNEIALMALLPALAAKCDDPRHTLYLEGSEKGWWYALPVLRRSYFAGFCTRREELKKRHVPLKEFFIQELLRTSLLAPLFESKPSGFQISGRIAAVREFRAAAGEGWIAVGDAVFAPEPLKGMGIDWAVESARLGAEAILEAVRGRGSGAGKFAEYDYVISARAARKFKEGK
jgi:flavin-dependent dehydrogenase